VDQASKQNKTTDSLLDMQLATGSVKIALLRCLIAMVSRVCDLLKILGESVLMCVSSSPAGGVNVT